MDGDGSEKKLIKDKKKEKAAKLPKIASATQLENQDVIFDKKKKKKKAMSYFGDHSDSEEEAVPLQYPAVNISSKHIDKHVHEIILCQECESVQCTLTCLQCEQNYCEKCLLKLHSKSRKNLSIILGAVPTSKKFRHKEFKHEQFDRQQ